MTEDAKPEQASPLDVADKWIDRLLKYIALVTAVTGALAAFVTYGLPHMRVVSPIIWMVVSLVAMGVGFYGKNDRLRARESWRFVCTIAAVLSMAAWIYASGTYLIRVETEDIPRGYHLELSLASASEVDAVAIRLQERERIERENAEAWSDIREFVAAWLWLLSCLLWSVTLVHSMHETHSCQE